MRLRSHSICTPDGIVDGWLEYDKGVITNIVKGADPKAVDLGTAMIIPGIFDTHNHSCNGWSISGATEQQRVDQTRHYLKALASHAVTSVFPTLFYDQPCQAGLDELATAAGFVGQLVDGACSAGVHYEGPFLNRVGEHGQRPAVHPIDLDYVRRCIELGHGRLKLMGHAPELPGSAAMTAMLVENGVTAAFTHTDCTAAQAFEAFDRGITVATHTCNVMVGIHHRDVGGMGACLLDQRVYCELIADGLHVCNDMLKLILRAKPHDHVMLISDSSHFVGLPAGHYASDGTVYNIDAQGHVYDANGSLSGSSKPVLYDIGNLVRNVGIDMTDALKMSSLYPARKYGLADRKGALEPGKDADFAIVSPSFDCLQTYVGGVKVFDHATDTDLDNPEILKKKID